jgi:hypothetical protein
MLILRHTATHGREATAGSGTFATLSASLPCYVAPISGARMIAMGAEGASASATIYAASGIKPGDRITHGGIVWQIDSVMALVGTSLVDCQAMATGGQA